MDDKPQRDVIVNEDRIFIIVKGKKGAVVLSKYLHLNSSGWSVDYHTYRKQHEWDVQSKFVCEFISESCFCDGRSVEGIRPGKFFEYLEEEYKCLK